MKNAAELLTRYAAYHRDRRNIVSHFVGVPMIVFAIGMLLARPAVAIGGIALTPGWIVFAAAALWYLRRGGGTLGVAVTLAVALSMALSHRVAAASGSAWLIWGGCIFVIGWLIQFIGHWYEGKKPAFVDDVVGLLVGPMFVVAEAMFMLGWNEPLQRHIEERVGPTVLRDIAKIA